MHPVALDVAPPVRFERVQLVLRLAVALAIATIGISTGWLMGVLYFGLPAFAAVVISSRGGERFLGEVAPQVVRLVRWVVAFYAYMLLLTDRFPTGEPYEGLRFEVKLSGAPSVRTALVRLATALPSAIVLALLAVPGGVVWLIAAVGILARGTYSPALFSFQRALLRWQARLLAYLASVVDDYPPFALDLEPEAPHHDAVDQAA